MKTTNLEFVIEDKGYKIITQTSNGVLQSAQIIDISEMRHREKNTIILNRVQPIQLTRDLNTDLGKVKPYSVLTTLKGLVLVLDEMIKEIEDAKIV